MKQTAQDSRCHSIPRFQILIVTAVKICKQYLQIASGGLCPQDHLLVSPVDHTGGLPSPDPPGHSPPNEYSGRRHCWATRFVNCWLCRNGFFGREMCNCCVLCDIGRVTVGIYTSQILLILLAFHRGTHHLYMLWLLFSCFCDIVISM